MTANRYIVVCVLGISITACGENNLDKVKQQSLDNFIYVQGGTFTMGDFGRDIDGKHYNLAIGRGMEPHQVTLTGYSLGKYQVTWFDYDTFLLATKRPVLDIQKAQLGKLGSNGWGEKRTPYSKVTNKKDRNYLFYYLKPASVQWQDAKDYCQWLGQELKLPIDLVTEAQWEYAGRDRGKEVIYANATSTQPNPPLYHDYSKLSTQLPSLYEYEPVGTFSTPNGLGFYDMDNNGTEWVNDWYSQTYYTEHPTITDPQGPETGELKTMRSWETVIGRNGAGPKAFVTFRCAVNSPEPVKK
jgi:formylglycine-generating enzyme